MPSVEQPPILQTRRLKKYFGEVRAVDDVDFGLREGELVALIGPNGAGKTTFVNLITGYLKPDRGEIIYNGRNITTLHRTKKIRLGIARSFQLTNLFEDLSVMDNIRIAVLTRMAKNNIFYRQLDSDEGVRSECLAIAEQFGLGYKAGLQARALPQGERKLLDVAIAFALKPRVLLLDEPTSGVSTRDKHDIMARIVKVVKEEKVATIIIEHDMDIVFRYSDRVVVFYEGKILADGKPEEIKQDAKVKEYLLGGIAA